MTLTSTEPIAPDWTSSASGDASDDHGANPEQRPSVRDVSRLLAGYEVADIGDALVPHLAAAAAELAITTGTSWSVTADDAPVVLLRIIAKVNLRHPEATGPHTAGLFALLDESPR